MINIAVIGPGAVGSTIAFDLKYLNSNIQLLGRRAETLQFYTNGDTKTAYTLDVAPLHVHHQPVDVLFIAVKIPQLDSVLSEYSHLLHSETIIILAQNGQGQLSKFDHPHVYQGVVYISGQKKGNIVTHYRDHKIILERNLHTQKLSKLVADSALNIELTEDINKAIWYKLLVNLAINSVTALSRSTASVLEVPGMKTLCRQLLLEGIAIAKAEHILFDHKIVDDILEIYEGYPSNMGTSMYYDILANKPLEIEGIQGYLFSIARKHQLETPILDSIYALLLAQQPIIDK
ncbi:oxidoreductase [Staphylococcus caeli]|uniref:2-dehydropantoate 2-reductase n=1 Tax=Staphylococcus caeli TaxID=2201815 RepID=A0A1D4LSN7_9STAP|nr:oxidoreductase [Staphylococcus caeli]SCS63333.1 2-dehydropantoate 2-reductase [Staphylococcus caeli]SCS89271.1 2-dehydropantoate 2-reductase [Staphylococcus caeli]